MQLDLKAMAYAGGALWGLAALFVSLINLTQPAYGMLFLQCLSSIYPGYHATRTFGDVLVGTGYALIDGAIAGWMFGWLYNRVVSRWG